MAFDAKAFMQTQFQPRTAEVEVKQMAAFFGDDKPVFIVRGATASEVARMLEAGDKRKNIDSIIKAVGVNADKIKELREAIGISDDTPADTVKRLEQLVACCVDPVIDDLSIAVKIAEAFPIEFYVLTNKITELTGLGMDIKKSKASGKTRPSEG